MARRNAVLEAVIEELEEAEVDYRIERRSHIHVSWGNGGPKQRVIISQSASDHRAAMNARCDVRRKLGVMYR
jgi:hypothetical protein